MHIVLPLYRIGNSEPEEEEEEPWEEP